MPKNRTEGALDVYHVIWLEVKDYIDLTTSRRRPAPPIRFSPEDPGGWINNFVGTHGDAHDCLMSLNARGLDLELHPMVFELAPPAVGAVMTPTSDAPLDAGVSEALSNEMYFNLIAGALLEIKGFECLCLEIPEQVKDYVMPHGLTVLETSAKYMVLKDRLEKKREDFVYLAIVSHEDFLMYSDALTMSTTRQAAVELVREAALSEIPAAQFRLMMDELIDEYFYP